MSEHKLSDDAVRLVCAAFRRGKKSRLNTIRDRAYVEHNIAVLDELVVAKLVSRRRKPRHKDVMLYRGSDACVEIWENEGKKRLRDSVPARGRIEPAKPRIDVHENRMVQDPYITDAEFIHQRRTKSGPHVGKIAARVNMVELIGGLARLSDRTEPQEAAAAKFRLIVERSQIGGAKACDLSAVRVDTTGPSEEAVFEIGERARREYAAAVRHLGMLRSRLIERVVVYDVPVSKIAGPGARARERTKRELFDALDDLAVHFGLMKKRAA